MARFREVIHTANNVDSHASGRRASRQSGRALRRQLQSQPLRSASAAALVEAILTRSSTTGAGQEGISWRYDAFPLVSASRYSLWLAITRCEVNHNLVRAIGQRRLQRSVLFLGALCSPAHHHTQAVESRARPPGSCATRQLVTRDELARGDQSDRTSPSPLIAASPWPCQRRWCMIAPSAVEGLRYTGPCLTCLPPPVPE
jgi:hypothetical protein